MLKRILSVATVVLLLSVAIQARASDDDLLMIAPLNQNMPMALFQHDKLIGGILKDLGEAIARRLGRSLHFVSVAGEQVGSTLSAGKADGICYVRPFWIDGDFDWSRALIPDAELVAASPGAPPVRALSDLRDRPVGTVTGYRYPRVEQVLGARFVRVDSGTMEDNLRKLYGGAVRYTVITRSTLAWQLREHKTPKMRADLVFASFSAQCAFSKRSNVPFAEVDKAINSLVEDGSVEDILVRYR